jgi:hypothetical protein
VIVTAAANVVTVVAVAVVAVAMASMLRECSIIAASDARNVVAAGGVGRDDGREAEARQSTAPKQVSCRQHSWEQRRVLCRQQHRHRRHERDGHRVLVLRSGPPMLCEFDLDLCRRTASGCCAPRSVSLRATMAKWWSVWVWV